MKDNSAQAAMLTQAAQEAAQESDDCRLDFLAREIKTLSEAVELLRDSVEQLDQRRFSDVELINKLIFQERSNTRQINDINAMLRAIKFDD